MFDKFRLKAALVEYKKYFVQTKNMLTSQLTGTCYSDPELRTLTIDVGFFISRYYNEEGRFFLPL